MRKLIFRHVHVKNYPIWVVVLFLFEILGNILSFDSEVENVHSIFAAMFSLGALGVQYWLLTKLRDSLEDEVSGKRINIAVLLMAAGVIIMRPSVVWLILLGLLIYFIGFCFYASIGVRCHNKGDERVKKFGDLLIISDVVVASIISLIPSFVEIVKERGNEFGSYYNNYWSGVSIPILMRRS